MLGLLPVPALAFSARIQHAVVNMNIDTTIPTQITSDEIVISQPEEIAASSEFIDSLWTDPSNQDLVQEFLGNSFTSKCAQEEDEECLPSYRKYSVQDYFYLEDYVKYKAHRLTTLPEGNIETLVNESKHLVNDAKYAKQSRDDYVNILGGNETDLNETNRNIEVLAYGNFLQSQVSEQDWFNMHVISIPCIYGWIQIAQKLKADSSTKNDTVFYKNWIEANADDSYADDLSTFLDNNVDEWKSQVNTGTDEMMGRWNYLFRTALRFEIALFESALRP